MAKKCWIERNNKRKKEVAKYTKLRKELKDNKEYEKLSQLPRNASPIRITNRCAITGRAGGNLRRFGLSRLCFRELAWKGELPGVKKSKLVNKQTILDKATAGEIIALVGLKATKSGNTLCDPDNKILLENMKIPEPVVSMSIEPKTKADNDKLGLVLKKFLDEDPSLRVNYNHETAQTIISGMGELHLEIIVDRMRREFNLEADVGRPEVAYKETITQEAKGVEGKFISQTGGRGQYGHVVVNVEKTDKKGDGFVFINQIKGGAIPREFFKPIEKGFKEGLLSGVVAGYPVTDIKITLYDGSFHDVDSSELSFQMAAKEALKEGLKKGKSVLLEPIMDVELVAPDEFMGAVMGDINTRRAQIVNTGMIGQLKTCRCNVPLAEMFNYVNAIRSLSQGRASFTMEPSFYDVVPQFVTDKIIGAKETVSNKKS